VIVAAVAAVPSATSGAKGGEPRHLAGLILRMIKALATPLVVLAILSAIVSNEIRGRQGARMMIYYVINTLVAITIGLTLSNLISRASGDFGSIAIAPKAVITTSPSAKPEPQGIVKILFDTIPRASATPSPRTTWPSLSWSRWLSESVWRGFATNSGRTGRRPTSLL